MHISRIYTMGVFSGVLGILLGQISIWLGIITAILCGIIMFFILIKTKRKL